MHSYPTLSMAIWTRCVMMCVATTRHGASLYREMETNTVPILGNACKIYLVVFLHLPSGMFSSLAHSGEESTKASDSCTR